MRLHNIWFGNSKTTTIEKPGHDLIGAISFAAHTKINLWYSERYSQNYHHQLENTAIKPRCIESYLREKITQGGELGKLAADVQTLLTQILDSEARGTIRDYVTAKEAFGFFLLATEGGVLADTNVLFTAEKLAFSDYPNFRMLGFHGSVETDENDADVDVCVMYSNPNNPAHAMRALKIYLKLMGDIENNPNISKNSEHYNQAVLHCVIKAALQKNYPDRDVSYFTALRLGRNFPVKIIDKNFRLLKRYYNTHGAQDRGVISDLVRAVVLRNTGDITRLLEAGADINEITHSEDYRNITPLNVATFYGYSEIVALLIARGAKDVELKVQNRLVNPAHHAQATFSSAQGRVADNTVNRALTPCVRQCNMVMK